MYHTKLLSIYLCNESPQSQMGPHPRVRISACSVKMQQYETIHGQYLKYKKQLLLLFIA